MKRRRKKLKNLRRKNDNTARTPGSSRMENTKTHRKSILFACLASTRLLLTLHTEHWWMRASFAESILRSRASCRGRPVHIQSAVAAAAFRFNLASLGFLLCRAPLNGAHHTRVVALNQACIVDGAVGRGLSIIEQCVWCTLSPKPCKTHTHSLHPFRSNDQVTSANVMHVNAWCVVRTMWSVLPL